MVLAGLAAVLLASVTAGLTAGSVAVPPGEVWGILLRGGLGLPWPEAGWSRPRETIVLEVRAPRVLLGAVVGAGLAVLGTAMQALVRNPLADPYLLGVSSGASLGAVAVIVGGVTFAGMYALPLGAFAGALLALVLVYGTARAAGRITALRLVLAGVAVASVLSALTSLLLLTQRGNEAREVLAWMLGGLGGARWDTLWLPAAVLGAALAALAACARPLNLLLAGEEAAGTMGLDVGRFRTRLFVALSLVTGVLVAAAGPIGFVGLMLPHAVRLVVGGDHRRVLPAAALGGAAFLVLADLAARTVAAPQEIPVGVLTSLCGGPFFLWLMRRDGRRAAR
ncbi:iron ABC transporter permease [Streptomyces sp. DSM 44917]|uniref:Iron ABC transporter permease n=1 Tax=Streptomyces boetiae TaxID=3075541 RepID=A0ABU2LCD0_9ACTN|nr:iron ABC transporter permease [Streptomyces sp. DSM 44917]MDT0308843.1 iron ABC transporter permease [Streptomyces sp. DSM 44917]